ncbi:MAG: polyphosphate kinase 1 [Erysipelotrichia bacterium]|jgi:polyphosphate kinase|nr:polyphosphate kinase 1 [Erysipelotrichia bacterium]
MEHKKSVTPNLFINREISWLEFNKRVLYQALDEATPLLERLGFVSIYGSNLDEFFMVRIGSLSDQMIVIPDKIDDKTGQTAQEQINEVWKWLNSHDKEVEKAIRKVLGKLPQIGISILQMDNLEKVDELLTRDYFNKEIKPLLSAQIVDPHHPFPFLKNKQSYVMAQLEDKNNRIRYGIVHTENLPKFINYSINERERVVITSDLITHNLSSIFKKYTVKEAITLRVTRNADIDIATEMMDEHEDFLNIMEKVLIKRKRLGIVRVQLSHSVSGDFNDYLKKVLNLKQDVVVVNNYPLDLEFGFGLKRAFKDKHPNDIYPAVSPVNSIDFANQSGLDYLKNNDLLLHYPYQSSQPFIQLLYEAANNPNVVSIKITLYCLSSPSRIASALAYAAEKGKQVVAVMELRARFDEQSNIDYSKILEDAGCTIHYGLSDYKVHSKVCLITMREKNRIRYFTYVGTGNFNENTQEQYTDLAYITSDSMVGEDANLLFDALSVNEIVEGNDTLWIAPLSFRSEVIKEIDNEIEYHKLNGNGNIEIKLNSMNDVLIMEKLIEASQQGVKVFLLIRGICCLLPNVKEYTDNITVKSIVGRHLEHSRIFKFGDGGRARIFIGSGDFLNRNTQRRVEAFIQIKQPDLKVRVNHILSVEKNDESIGWIMQSDGSYINKNYDSKKHSQDVLREYFSMEELQSYDAKKENEGLLQRLKKRFLG